LCEYLPGGRGSADLLVPVVFAAQKNGEDDLELPETGSLAAVAQLSSNAAAPACLEKNESNKNEDASRCKVRPVGWVCRASLFAEERRLWI